MSVQLILYPQNHSGIFNPISTSIATTEYVVNGIDFTGMNSTSLYNSSSSFAPFPYFATGGQASFINQGMAVSPGVWRRFTSLSSPTWGDVAAPQSALNSLVLAYNATAGYTGVSQRLSNLVIGAEYTVTINISATVVGSLAVIIYDGIVPVADFGGGTTYQSLVGPFNYTFTATSSYSQSIQLVYTSATASISIKDVSITKTIPGVNSLIDGQVICDLYEDEDIPLSLSIDDFKNVAEQVKSYSKDFNLPATKRNNRIFDQMYEITRADDGIVFNPYVKTQCVLKQDGFILFEGYLRLIDVKDKEGEISYNVNLYSEVVALADVLKDRTFSELNFTELENDYNIGNILHSWNNAGTSITYTNPSTSGFRDAYKTLRYPYIDWNHQFSADPTTGSPNLNNLEAAFRPCIQLKYLIQNIFAPTEFNFISNFFDSADFDRLYMDFNWGADNTPANVSGSTYSGQAPAAATVYLLPFATANFSNLQLANYQSNAWVTPPNYNQTSNILTATQVNETYTIDYDYYCSAAVGDTTDFQWLHTSAAGVPYPAIDATTIVASTPNFFYYTGSFTIVMQTGDTLEAQFKTNGAATFQLSSFASTVIFVQSISAVTSQTFLQTLRGELGQWDFLKGIMTMFNLVSLVDESDPNTIHIEPYSDVFINNTKSGVLNDLTLASRGIQHDWTEKVDVSEMELKPLTNLNKKTVFKFVEDEDDYAFNVYKNSTGGRLYGSQTHDASGFNILEGEEEIIAEPFAATVSKPLMDQYTDLIVPALYAQGSDNTWEGFENSPRIFYNNYEQSLASCSPHVPAQNGSADYYFTTFLQFSHLSTIPSVSATTKDFVFNSQQLLSGVGNPPTDNLYSTYWQPYFNELYNADTRIMTLKVNLSPSDVSNFKFYDTVFIKNRVFRVNKIDYKPNALAKVEFILIP